MRSVGKQIEEMFGGMWKYDGINCWECGESFVRRIKGLFGSYVYMHYENDESTPTQIKIWR